MDLTTFSRDAVGSLSEGSQKVSAWIIMNKTLRGSVRACIPSVGNVYPC